MNEKTPLKIAIIGAGAAGLMCGIEASKKGHHVSLFDHAKKPGEKIRISGGGRCNFTNKYCTAQNFIGQNKHFHKSALTRYPASSFISMVESHKIPYHEKHPEKETGQLFCDGKSQAIIDMLLDENKQAGTSLFLETAIDKITPQGPQFTLKIKRQNHVFDKVVIATGGPSIPKMGASDFGYKIARQFGHDIIPTEPALVPLTFTDEVLNLTKTLSGLSIDSVLVQSDSRGIRQIFKDDLLFTHRGLSGPAILQISSYWSAGDILKVNLLPAINLQQELLSTKNNSPKMRLRKFLSTYLPTRFIDEFLPSFLDPKESDKNLADLSHQKIELISKQFQTWEIKPNGSEGYRTAEVTRGGVNTNEIDGRTFESKMQSGLYFIGEVLDVTGHLGGHNFQWAWASGYCCGQDI